MSVHLKTDETYFEIGSSDFFIAFFDTIECRLTKGLFSKKYPTILEEFYNGKLSYTNLNKAKIELEEIRRKLKKFKPSKVVWDKHDKTKVPPWGNDISEDITDLSNYFITSDGKDLFEVIFNAIQNAEKNKSDIIIQ